MGAEHRKHVSWQNYILSVIAVLVVLAGAFCLKLAFGTFVSVSAKSLCVGALLGIAVIGCLLKAKKLILLLVLSLAFLAAWLLLPGARFISAVMYAAGCVCLIGSIPLIAALLALRSAGDGVSGAE
jgi:hypothetical protein